MDCTSSSTCFCNLECLCADVKSELWRRKHSSLEEVGESRGGGVKRILAFRDSLKTWSLLEISLLLHAVSFHVFRFVVGEFPIHSGLYASRARRTLGLIKPVEQFSEKVCPVIYQGLTECVPAAAPPYHRSTRAMLTTTTNALSMWPTTRTF
jgi:hypothetical protein